MGSKNQKIELNEDQIKTASRLAGIGCTMEQISYILGFSPKTLDRLVERDERVADALARGRSDAASQVLTTAFDMATSGKHPWMTGFWLKCKLRWSEPRGEEMPADQEKKFELNYKK